MEMNEVMPRLFERFPKLEVAVADEELVPAPSIISNGVEALPVRLR